MTFLVLIVGLLVLRFGGELGRLQRDHWFDGWRARLASATPLQQRPALRALLAAAVPALALALLLWLLRDLWLGLPAFAISLLVLLYSFGRGDLEGDLAAYRAAVGRGDTQAAYHDAAPFSPAGRESEAQDWPGLQADLEAGLTYRLFEREFAVVFLFAVLGPAGALLYRLSHLLAQPVAPPPDEGEEAAAVTADEESEVGARLVHGLEWLPARLLVASLAVVGNFVPVMQRFPGWLFSALAAAPLLAEAVRSALVLQREDLEQPGGLEWVTAVEDLLRRALIFWVLVVALLVLFF